MKHGAAAIQLHVVAAALFVFIFGVASAARAQDEAFKEGMEARDDKQWAKVATQMRAAIQVNPADDGHTVRTGFLGRKSYLYVPRLYLAEALSKTPSTGCLEAVETWAALERQSVLRGRDELNKILTLGYAECDKAGVLPPARFEPLYAKAKTQVDDALGHASRVFANGEANMAAWRNDMREQYSRATAELNTARERLAQGQKNRNEAALTGAFEAAARGRALLVTVDSFLAAAVAAQQKFAAQLREAEQAVNTAEESDRAIDARKKLLTPPLATTYRDSRDLLGRARGRLTVGKASGGVDTGALADATTAAREASARFARIAAELARLERAAQGRQVADALARGREAFLFIDGSLATLTRLAEEKPSSMTPAKAAERDAIQKQVTLIRKRFEAASKGENLAAIVTTTRATTEPRDRLNALIGTFGPVTLEDRGVHQALVNGSNQYFSGEYEQALATLSPADGFAADLPLRSHVHMFRAAALHALFERSGGKDQALRARAIAEIEQCKQVSGTVQPDARAFGPRFIAFYQAVGAQAANATPAGPARP